MRKKRSFSSLSDGVGIVSGATAKSRPGVRETYRNMIQHEPLGDARGAPTRRVEKRTKKDKKE